MPHWNARSRPAGFAAGPVGRAILRPMIRGSNTARVASAPARAPDATSLLAGLAEALVDTLPTGSTLVVCWRDAHGVQGMSAAADAPPGLQAHAWASLEGASDGTGLDELDACWDEGDTRIAIATRLAQPLPSASRAAWLALARRTAAATLASAQAHARIL